MRKVVVHEEQHPVTSYKPGAMTTYLVGTVISRVYQGESVQRHLFLPAGQDAEDETNLVSMGPTSTSFDFVDYAGLVEPFLDQGRKSGRLKQTWLFRGGTCFRALIELPMRGIPDPIEWDLDLWESNKVGTLRQVIEIVSSVKPGHGIRITRGLFRLVCSNGLISKVLNLGFWKFSHSNFNPETVAQIASSSGEYQDFTVGNKKGAERFLGVLQQDEVDESIPYFVQSSMGVLSRLPKWYVSGLQVQMQEFIDHSPVDRIGPLDLMNMLTSPMSLYEEASEASIGRLSGKMESITKATMSLIGPLSL